jgi:hypothetical protein
MPGGFCCGEGEDGPAVGGMAYFWCVTGDWCSYVALFFVYASLLIIDYATIRFAIEPLYGLDTWKGMAHACFFQTVVCLVLACHLAARLASL